MSLFTKKEKIVLTSEEQKDAFIDKMERAHIKYDIREEKSSFSNGHTSFIARVNADDLKRVI